MKHISTTENQRWVTVNDIKVSDKAPTLVVTGDKKQSILGFGGCFNELGKIALNELDENSQKEVYDELFLEAGCNFNFNRMPIGANDFSEIWYSHNEVDGDYEMKNHNIERDYVHVIPYINEGKKRCPNMEIFASPWSPPTWLKFPKVNNYGKLVQTDENLTAYALYFVKFVKAYEALGIEIKQVHVQNESISSQKFPSCVMTGDEIRHFIENFLGPAFEANGIDTEIWFGTLCGPARDGRELYTGYNDYVNVAMESEKCKKYIKGVSYQWDGKYAIQVTNKAYPDLPLIQSESECGDGKNTLQFALYTFEMMNHYFRNGAMSYLYWNIALKAEGESTWGWFQNSMVMVDNGKHTYTNEFYVMKHFSHFVKKGAKYVDICGKWCANASCFENPNGEIVIAIMNPFKEAKTVAVEVKGKVYETELKPQSFNTLIF